MLFPSERPVFLREVQKGMYQVSSYFWSKIFTEMAVVIMLPLLSTVIIYWWVGFNTANWYNYPIHLLLNILSYYSFGGFGLMAGAFISNATIINIISSIIIVPMMLFSGFFVNQDNFPWFLTPFEYISVHKYAYQALILNEYNGLELDCMKTQDSSKICSPLEDFNAPQTLEQCIFAMLGMIVVTHILAYMCLSSKAKS